MKKQGWILLCLIGLSVAAAAGTERRLSVDDYRDRMMAAWIGQIAGVCWGAPTEFKFNDVIIPEDKVPVWRPEMINEAFGQDDLYVEMTFLRTLEQYGLDVGIRQAGLDFANSEYNLWCANHAGRMNLRSGIAPPASSHPLFTSRGNDIDYQIEADFSGIISPGLVNEVIRMGGVFGRLMNYGDGVLGGVFMGAMYAEAYFTNDHMKLLEAGLAAIPAESDYAEMVRSIMAWHAENPSDWTVTWRKIQEKYHPEGKRWTWKDTNGGIDARINGAMVVLGLLYGNGDFDKTIKIAMRGGYDSDCNPSSAAGPLFAMKGFRKLPARFTEKLVRKGQKFSYTSYDFDGLISVSEKLTRALVVRAGGRIEKDASGREWFVIPNVKPCVGAYTPTWKAKPCPKEMFTKEEMVQQKFPIKIYDPAKFDSPDSTVRVQKALDEIFPGWTTSENAKSTLPGYIREFNDVLNVVRTLPPEKGQSVVLTRKIRLPMGTPRLVLKTANTHEGDFFLLVRINGMLLLRTTVSRDNINGGEHWKSYTLGLTPWAGKDVVIEVENLSNDWLGEAAYAAYWACLSVEADNN